MFYASLRFFGIFIGTFLFLSLSTHAAHACSCMHQPDPEVAYKGAKYVFTAKVAKVTEPKLNIKTYHFETQQAFKGEIDPRFTKSQSKMRNMCHYYQYDDQATYLIYSNRKSEDDSYEISHCSRTKKVDQAQIELRYLQFFKNNKDRTAIDQDLKSIIETSQNTSKIQEALKLIAHNPYVSLDKRQKSALLKQHMKTEHIEFQKSILSSLVSFQLHGDQTAIEIATYILLHSADTHVKRNAAYTLSTIGSQAHIYDILWPLYQKKSAPLDPAKDVSDFAYQSELLSGILSHAKTTEQKQQALSEAIKYINHYQTNTPVNVIQRIGFMHMDGTGARSAILTLISELNKLTKTTYDYNKVQQLQYSLMTLGMIGNADDVELFAEYLSHPKCPVMSEASKALATLQAHEVLRAQAFPIFKNRFAECDHYILSALQNMQFDISEIVPFLQKQVDENKLQAWQINQIKELLKRHSTK